MIQIVDTSSKYMFGKRESLSFSLDVIDCRKLFSNRGRGEHMLSFEYNSIYCVCSGKVEADNAQLSKNDCFYIPPFSTVSVNITEAAELIKIVFSCTKPLIVPQGKKLLIFRDIPEIYIQAKKIYQLSYFKNNLPGTREGILLSLVNDMKKNAASVSSEIALYKKACQWIEDNAADAISAQDVANALGLSREHLGRVIKAVGGESLCKKTAEFRIIEIKRLCADKNLTLSDIAGELSFGSAELLCKFFKYHTGISVTEYRNNKFEKDTAAIPIPLTLIKSKKRTSEKFSFVRSFYYSSSSSSERSAELGLFVLPPVPLSVSLSESSSVPVFSLS